ncbi:MAG: ATP-binding cassette domain-containing protein [Acidobacteriaceae bacterium]|nr:ATP-binding cassette domain-containing protein [Acidobacteriaceae bacterium]
MAQQNIVDARVVKRFPAARDSQPFELNVHFRAADGATILFGPSGAGKTLLLNCLAGFTRPDEGRILLHDQLLFDAATHIHLAPQKRRCGYIFQDHALFPHMTVRENLRFAASAAPREKGRALNRHRRVHDLLDAFELADLAARKPAQLSGGQKQRAALARILLSEPRLLLLDEPTRGLDLRLRRAFYGVMRETRARLEIPIVMVTHDLDECFELADSVYLLDNGRVLQSGPREAVFARPASLDIARSLGIYNLLPATIAALDPGRHTSRLAVLGQEIEGPYFPGHFIGDAGFLCVRQSEIRVRTAETRSHHNRLSLRLENWSMSSSGIRLLFDHDAVATVSESEFEALRGENRLYLEIPPSAVYFIA